MTLTEADGSGMAGADVSVYYYPSVITAGVPLQLMGEATSDSSGTVGLSLDTSMVPAGDLGDTGDGVNDAFNALVIGSDPAGHQIIQHEVLTLNAATSDTASAQVGATGQPIVGTPISQVSNPSMAPVPDGLVNSEYRYVQVLAMNSGVGMSSKLYYTYSSTTARQTVIGVALDNLQGGAGWSISGSMLEQTNRQVNATFFSGITWLHQYLWASYLFDEYHYQGCTKIYCYNYYEWDPNHFEGYVTNDNPDYWKSGTKIGYVNYQVPGFTYCQGIGTCWFPLDQYHPTWSRFTETLRQTYGFQLNLADFINLNDWATYASQTGQAWWYHANAGCNSPDEEILWGNNVDPTTARIVQANCLDPYALNPPTGN